MRSTALRLRRVPTAETASQARSRVDVLRVALGDGAHTTLHVARYEREAFTPRVTVLERPMPLVQWCARHGVQDAVVGGFFSRPAYVPLGQIQTNGEIRASLPFDAPWGDVRACVQILDGSVEIARRDSLSATSEGDLLQAGPLLVCGGRAAVDGSDPEGFAAGAHQFDSDITRGRYPRAALAVSDDHLLTVACDGRGARDAGMTLGELAAAVVSLGASAALNLDGGGSSSLVYGGRLRNRPREQHGADLIGGRPVATAITLHPS